MSDILVLKHFHHKKILTLEELVSYISSSKITARRRLAKWNTYTSINCNGRYYVLPNIPKFDERGLWSHKFAFFSRHGNLRNTLFRLIIESDAGLNAQEITQLVGLRANSSFLSTLRNVPEICREKQHGRFVYFSGQHDICIRQQLQREQLLKMRQPGSLPSNADALIILVDRINYPDDSIEKCAHRLQKVQEHINVFHIRVLLEYHGLVKKTMDTLY